ncbi:MAG TPA: hypothetical protein VJL32_00440 [Candidatus Paceibacterota bacterium]
MAGDLANTQDLVEVKGIKNDTIMMKDGSLRQIIIVGGTNFALKSEEEQNSLTSAYQEFLNGLSFSIQIIIHSRKININPYLEKLEERRQQEISPLLQDQIYEYKEYVRSFVADNPIMNKTFFVVIPFYPINMSLPSAAGILSSLPFLNKKPKTPQENKAKDELLAESLQQLSQRTDQVAGGLANMGLEPKLLKDEALIELLYNFYNPEKVEKDNIKDTKGNERP